MTGTKDITQLCFSSGLAGILANKVEQIFYSVFFLFRNRVNRTHPWTTLNQSEYSQMNRACFARKMIDGLIQKCRQSAMCFSECEKDFLKSILSRSQVHIEVTALGILVETGLILVLGI